MDAMSPASNPPADELLVARSLAGDRSAFGAIVARYQSLVASIAYSATGSISRSEDLAQDIFLQAWRQLGALREPARLRAWLCGIARHRSIDALRADGREPSGAGETLDVIAAAPAELPAPVDAAISAEEQSLMWRALARLPETYREPLVLYYREQQSIAAVAAALELSEDSVKQRLSRGRRLLEEQVQAFVEGALARSAPGAAFTAGVLAALPLAAPTSAAAGVAMAASKSGAVAKSAGLAALGAALIGPVVAFAGSYFSVRAGLDATRTPRERALVVAQTREFGIASAAYTVLAVVALIAAPRMLPVATAYALLVQALPLVFGAWLAWRIPRAIAEVRALRAVERLRWPELFEPVRERRLRLRAEYRSRWRLFGLPLLHVRYDPPAPDAAPARAWIAIGDRADGVLFAMGGVARGGIAVGGVAIGLFAVGGVAIAPLALGGIAFGGLAFGGAAYAWTAIGGFATGWDGAAGALALAHGYAGGGLAVGGHANDAAVRQYFAQTLPDPTLPLLFLVLIVLSVFPAALFAWRTRANLRPK